MRWWNFTPFGGWWVTVNCMNITCVRIRYVTVWMWVGFYHGYLHCQTLSAWIHACCYLELSSRIWSNLIHKHDLVWIICSIFSGSQGQMQFGIYYFHRSNELSPSNWSWLWNANSAVTVPSQLLLHVNSSQFKNDLTCGSYKMLGI